MKEKHPNWSEKQLRCSLYWQGTARKKLKEKSSEFLKQFTKEGYVLISSPESLGVDVTRTMKNVGITLEWPVLNNVYKIDFAGQLLDYVKDKEYIKNRKKQITDKGYLVLEQPVTCSCQIDVGNYKVIKL